MTLHNYRSKQVHETLNGVNPSSSFRDMRSAKSGPNLWQIWQVFGPWASPYGENGHMTMTVHTYRPRKFHRTSNGENPLSGYRDMGSASLAAAHPAARPPRPWWQYPPSLKGWGVTKLIVVLKFAHALKLSWLGKYLYKSFKVRASARTVVWFTLPCADKHFPTALSSLIYMFIYVVKNLAIHETIF